VLPVRLLPGVDLRRALEELVKANGAGSAFVLAGIGSLVDAKLRFANAAVETTLKGPYEILTLSGTLTPNGAHLHMTVSDDEGRVFGGHLTYGNEIRTTAEVLLAWTPDWALTRELDPRTGFDELVVRAVEWRAGQD
jgi:predicted DNA-binding protein with PD1-like motif